MSNETGLKLAKWPFFLGNVILLGLAYFIFAQHGKAPMSGWEIFLFMASGTIGALLAVVPFVLEYRAAARMLESSSVVATVAEIRNLELIAQQINAATARWQVVQEHSNNTVAAAKQLAGQMSAETAAFTDFLQKANDSEKSTLRLEVEKSRRLESDWLQITVRLLDHVYALFRAAEQSGQPGLVEQLGRFQNSCREVTRRVGLLPLVPAINDAFDAQCHRLPEADAQAAPGAKIGNVIATGYTYQGRLLRPAMVELRAPAATDSSSDAEAESESEDGSVQTQEPTLL